MINAPNRIRIWESQLAANDFPPVCAMTGAQAETWRKFTFATPPAWAYLFLILGCLGGLGIIGYAIILYAASERASGYLPLTRTSARTVRLILWSPIAMFGAFILSTVIAVVLLFSDSQATGAVSAFALLLLFGAIVGRLVATPLIAPRGKVSAPQPGYFQRLVEISNVHPVFVAAVQQLQLARSPYVGKWQ